jgi:hypothetical protein
MSAKAPESVAEVKSSLAEVGYLADEPAALVSYLSQRLGKPERPSSRRRCRAPPAAS